MNANNNNYSKRLRNGSTSVQGIGLKDIVRIRKEKGIPYTKPHMAGGRWRSMKLKHICIVAIIMANILIFIFGYMAGFIYGLDIHNTMYKEWKEEMNIGNELWSKNSRADREKYVRT